MHGKVLEKLIVTQLVKKALAFILPEIAYCFDNRRLLDVILRYIRNENDQRFQSGVLRSGLQNFVGSYTQRPPLIHYPADCNNYYYYYYY